MKKVITILSFLAIGSIQMNAQTGINTSNPGSTLDVNGSLAAQYRSVTATTYAMNQTDFHISYNGTGNAAFTLPAAISGVGNFKGRLYTIKNNTAFTVTVSPAASETIGGSTSVSLTPNQSVQIINTGLTGAATTWEVIAQNTVSGTGIGCLPDYMFATLGTRQQTAININPRIRFNVPKSSAGITVDNNGVFSLKAGKTYELEANLFATDFFNNTTYLQAAWKNAGTGAVLPETTIAEMYSVGYTTTNNAEMPVSKAVITPTADMTVALDITTSNAYAYINNNQSYAMIRQLNSCGGGGGNTTIVNNSVTASNGLNATANDVKLGGTLSQATNIANAGNNLTITGTGNVGVGTSTPRIKLEVYGILGVQTGPFPNTINMAAFGWDAIQPGVGFNEYVNYRGTGDGGHRFYSLPNTGTPVLANSLSYLDINGSWHAAAYAVSSDSRLKRNIKPLENGLDIISRLQPVSYEKRLNLSSQDYNTKEIGFLAQELRKVLPDAVKEDTTDPDKLLSVNYDSLIGVLTKAFQELNAKVEKLEAENTEFKNLLKEK
ncbi:hypothetical protein ASG22_08925 [Chryseobacterium sp. Leaf405]|uniref:tail fiber domain-containing protein n=1 Tax=Chryseobacterium sp. Leaf405 TaxID=1736367 RepID=UPI0006F3501C|nr:tail fiber domain-containing protein [Chryseobacterium sp. Leaf405]KQT24129.1 hypothetical protein ASG22_08925 [Chryseobacterium sp. Leaf405]